MSNRNSGGSDGFGSLVLFILGIAVMPIVGVFFMCSEDSSKRAWGEVKTILGLLIWAYIGFSGSERIRGTLMIFRFNVKNNTLISAGNRDFVQLSFS